MGSQKVGHDAATEQQNDAYLCVYQECYTSQSLRRKFWQLRLYGWILQNHAYWNVRQEDKYCMISLIYRIKTKHSRWLVFRGGGWGDGWSGQKAQTSSYKICKDVTHSMWLQLIVFYYRLESCLDFPGFLVVENLHSQCRGHEFSTWSRKIPHTSGQLSPCASTTEAPALEPVLYDKRSHCNEKPVHWEKDPAQPINK